MFFLLKENTSQKSIKNTKLILSNKVIRNTTVLAEGEGFEPSEDFHILTRFPGGFLRPLGHPSVSNWCRRRDLNPHGLLGHWILSPARLPISPLRHCFYWRRGWDSNPRACQSGPRDFKSPAFVHSATPPSLLSSLEAAAGFEPANEGFAVPRLRPLGYAAIVLWSGQRDSNPQPSAWKADALPN